MANQERIFMSKLKKNQFIVTEEQYVVAYVVMTRNVDKGTVGFELKQRIARATSESEALGMIVKDIQSKIGSVPDTNAIAWNVIRTGV